MMRIAILLAVFCAVSAALVLLPINVQSNAELLSAEMAEAEIAPAFRAVPISSYPTISARPLFAKERKRGGTATIETPIEAEEVPVGDFDAVLIGVYLSGDVRRALIATARGGEGRWYDIGAIIGGWEVARIDAEEVHVTAGGKTSTLQLYEQDQGNVESLDVSNAGIGNKTDDEYKRSH